MINDKLLNKSSPQPFFCKFPVKKSKDRLLKNRLQTLIFKQQMTEADFYKSLGISKQYWFCLSWGIWDCPVPLKIKIAQALGTDSSLIWQDKGDREQ